MLQRLRVQVERFWGTLSARERSIVTICALGGIVLLLWTQVEAISEGISDTERDLLERRIVLEDVKVLGERYLSLKKRLEQASRRYDTAGASLEEVTSELDRIIKSSIGESSYELKKTSQAVNIGEFDKQEFTVRLKKLDLPQLVKILHELEYGDTPLYLGKLTINKQFNRDYLSANLEVFSIQQRTPA